MGFHRVAWVGVFSLGLGVTGFVGCSPSAGAGSDQTLPDGGGARPTPSDGGRDATPIPEHDAKAPGASAVPSESGADVVLDSGTTRTGTRDAADGSCLTWSARADPQRVTVDVATPAPVALYLMQDRSGSMRDTPPGNTSTKWDQAVSNLDAFVTDPKSANLDVALGFFPVNGGGCDGTNYSTPVVPLGRLPSATQALAVSTAITSNAPGNAGASSPGSSGTPIEGALRGAENFCMAYHGQNPQEPCIVVLITDGAPNGCDQNFSSLSGIVADAKTRAGIATFAVGMDGADFGLLDQLATAGGSSCGTTPSCNVNGNGTNLIDALNKIRTTVTQGMTSTEGTTHPCQYSIPAPMNGRSFDPATLNVQITRAGAVRKIGQVADKAACSHAADDGWYYDDPLNPKSVTLCSDLCGSLTPPDAGLDGGATSRKIEFLFGCPTELAAAR